MIGRERRSKTNGTVGHRLRDHRAHARQLLIGRLGLFRSRLPHHGGAYCRVAGKHRHIGNRTDPPQMVEILTKALKAPIDAFEQRGQIHALDNRQIAQHGFALLGWTWRNAKAAVTNDRRRHAERR